MLPLLLHFCAVRIEKIRLLGRELALGREAQLLHKLIEDSHRASAKRAIEPDNVSFAENITYQRVRRVRCCGRSYLDSSSSSISLESNFLRDSGYVKTSSVSYTHLRAHET